MPSVSFLALLYWLKTTGLSGRMGTGQVDFLAISFSHQGSIQYFTILGDVCFRFSIDPLFQIKKVEGRDFFFFFLMYPGI